MRSFHRELLKLNFSIALSNDDKRLAEKSVSLLHREGAVALKIERQPYRFVEMFQL